MRHDLRRIGRLALFASALLALPPTAPRAQALYDAFVEAVAADRSDQVRALLARGIDPEHRMCDVERMVRVQRHVDRVDLFRVPADHLPEALHIPLGSRNKQGAANRAAKVDLRIDD